MGIVIRGTGVSTDASVGSSIEHAARAAEACVRAAGVHADEIDFLINVGVYRDNNMVEPAMSALIQREIGIGLDYVREPGKKPVFSFDLMNGACGILNAVHVGSAYLEVGRARYVLIVSSDTHPSNKPSPDFPYAMSGGAMLLEKNCRPGFGRVRVRATASGLGTEGFVTHGTAVANGRERVTVRQAPDYVDRLAELAVEAIRDYAVAEGIALEKTLLVTPQVSPDFGRELARRLGLPEDQAVSLGGHDERHDPHTSALTHAYHVAKETGRLARYDQVLFVAAGAGLTSACAVYRP